MKILVVKPSSLGDVIQALPVLRLLKHRLPESRIHWWIEDRWAPLLDQDPDLAGHFTFRRRHWPSPRYWPELVASLRQIRAARFDWVIDLQSLARSSLVAWVANGGLTIGLDDGREGASAFYDIAVPGLSLRAHAVDRYLSALAPLGVPLEGVFTWLPERPATAEAIRARWPVAGPRWIALQPGARWLNKRWPVEHFAVLARDLTSRDGDTRCVVLGGDADRELGGVIAEAAPGRVLDLTGRTSLWEMIEWLRACALLVTNDSGPMHAAAALGVPVVALFGPTDPGRTGPYGQLAAGVVQHQGLPCLPCLSDHCSHPEPLACLHSIDPGLVAESVWRRLLVAPAAGTRGKWLACGSTPLRLAS